MKALSKPISSPGRAEKFPTPLMMRFLRTNVGSRSRGRSRSSPMFILRSKKNGNAPGINETQQEPSSPKVTCIGQVRVRRSSKSKKNSSKSKKNKDDRSASASACSATQPHCLCYPSSSCTCSCSCSSWCCSGVPRSSIFGCFSCRYPKPKSFYNPFRKCLSFFHFGCCKKVNIRDDSSRFGSIIHRNQNHVTAVSSTPSDIEEDFCDRNIVKGAQLLRQGSRKQGFPQSCSPPKNALLLTRCRSAPYRSSSLASRFWGSPLRSSSGTETPPKEEDEEEPEEPPPQPPPEEEEEEEEKEDEDEKMGRRPISPKLINEEAESRNSVSHEEKSKESDSSRNERPLQLTRCKSEPARTGERLNPESNLFTQRRSDTAESCLQLPQINCD